MEDKRTFFLLGSASDDPYFLTFLPKFLELLAFELWLLLSSLVQLSLCFLRVFLVSNRTTSYPLDLDSLSSTLAAVSPSAAHQLTLPPIPTLFLLEVAAFERLNRQHGALLPPPRANLGLWSHRFRLFKLDPGCRHQDCLRSRPRRCTRLGRSSWHLDRYLARNRPPLQGYRACQITHPTLTCLPSDTKNGSIRLWSAETNTTAVTFNGHKKAVIALTFDSQGLRVASASLDTDIILWIS